MLIIYAYHLFDILWCLKVFSKSSQGQKCTELKKHPHICYISVSIFSSLLLFFKCLWLYSPFEDLMGIVGLALFYCLLVCRQSEFSMDLPHLPLSLSEESKHTDSALEFDLKCVNSINHVPFETCGSLYRGLWGGRMNIKTSARAFGDTCGEGHMR